MSQAKVVVITLVICCLGIAAAEINRQTVAPTNGASAFGTDGTNAVLSSPKTIRAPGRIAGATEEIELVSQLSEKIEQVHVRHGDFVKAGTVLVTVQKQTIETEKELAAAVVQQREAELERLRNGSRQSEIDIAELEYGAVKARLEGASSKLERALKLREKSAISTQGLEDIQFNVLTLRALADASKNRLEALTEPARPEDVRISLAALRAAEANQRLVQERINKTEIRAPIDGTILKINGQRGELASVAPSEPVVVMCDSRRQRVLVEIDEFDSLTVRLGQRCAVTSDGSDSVVASGTVTDIEPRMDSKKIFGQWAGERNDTFSRRVWVDLDAGTPWLPIGLPVQVRIDVSDPQPM